MSDKDKNGKIEVKLALNRDEGRQKIERNVEREESTNKEENEKRN